MELVADGAKGLFEDVGQHVQPSRERQREGQKARERVCVFERARERDIDRERERMFFGSGSGFILPRCSIPSSVNPSPKTKQ